MILKLAFKVQSSYSFWVPEYHAKKIKTVGKKQKKKKIEQGRRKQTIVRRG